MASRIILNCPSILVSYLVTNMSEVSQVLRLLETERERYVLEIADLERRLAFIRNQIQTLDSLISGYANEDQIYQTVGRLPESSSKQEAFLLHSSSLSSSHQDKKLEKALAKIESNVSEEDEEEEVDADISDIPKLSVPRKPGSLPTLKEFSSYSIQNAILILMRRRPHMHIHVDAIVRDLYGDRLNDEQFRTAKATASKMLSMGAQNGLWYRVLHAQGVYTLQYEKGVTSKPPKRR